MSHSHINGSDEMLAHPNSFPESCWDVCFREREGKTDKGNERGRK